MGCQSASIRTPRALFSRLARAKQKKVGGGEGKREKSKMIRETGKARRDARGEAVYFAAESNAEGNLTSRERPANPTSTMTRSVAPLTGV